MIEIPILKYKPKQHQKENYLIDCKNKWVKKGTVKHEELESLLDKPSSLWYGWDSSYNGKNDRIHESEVDRISGSLFFIKTHCTIIVKTEGIDKPKKKVRCSFTYNKTDYALTVTDPGIEQKYINESERSYSIGQKYVCVSLGMAYNGYLYLFVATIL